MLILQMTRHTTSKDMGRSVEDYDMELVCLSSVYSLSRGSS